MQLSPPTKLPPEGAGGLAATLAEVDSDLLLVVVETESGLSLVSAELLASLASLVWLVTPVSVVLSGDSPGPQLELSSVATIASALIKFNMKGWYLCE